MPLPNFLYIGYPRAGSTWLFQVLREHPEIFVPPAKDIYFFDRFFDRGLDWYEAFFAADHGAKAVGELSHDYVYSEQALPRISQTLPGVKLLCCIRDPVDWMISAYNFRKLTEQMGNDSVITFCQRPGVRMMVRYAEHLRRFREVYDYDQFLVLFYEELQQAPAEFIRSVYAFIEVDPNFSPPSLWRRINPARESRNERLAHGVYAAGRLVRHLGFANVVGRVKHGALMNALLYRQTRENKTIASPAERAELRAIIEPDLDEVEALVGRPLPKVWRRT